jgi:hypothetical protein
MAQITIGLETGMESLMQPEEYQKQLKYLSLIKNLEPVTMSDFATRYFNVYKIFIDPVGISTASYDNNSFYIFLRTYI